MLEMYIDDYLYPVFAMGVAAKGTFRASNTTVVTNVTAWKMSLPANADPGSPGSGRIELEL